MFSDKDPGDLTKEEQQQQFFKIQEAYETLLPKGRKYSKKETPLATKAGNDQNKTSDINYTKFN